MTTAEKKYADIIGMDRPEPIEILRKYPRQPMSERAKIFSPFAALRGHGERLSAEDDRLLLVERMELNEEEQKALSEKLGSLSKGDAVTLTYFVPVDEAQGLGRYETVTGTILEAEPTLQYLRLRREDEADLTIAFSDLGELYSEMEDESRNEEGGDIR